MSMASASSADIPSSRCTISTAMGMLAVEPSSRGRFSLVNASSTLLAVGVGARVMEGAPEPVGAFEAAEGVDSPDGCLWQPVGKASSSAARRQIPHLFIIDPSFPFLKTVVL